MRKKPRRPLHYVAKIITNSKEPARTCTISDISQRGARLVLENEEKLPDRFRLLLTRNGTARRRCRTVWQTGSTVGVEFTQR